MGVLGLDRVNTLWATAGMPQVMTMIVKGSTAGRACMGILRTIDFKGTMR